MALYDRTKSKDGQINKLVAQAVARFNAAPPREMSDPVVQENPSHYRRCCVVRAVKATHPDIQSEKIEQAYNRLGF